MPQQSYNVQNSVTGELVKDHDGNAIEYDTASEAQTAAIYFTTITGETHVVAGPHPKPHS